MLRSAALQDGPHIRPKYADLHCVRLHEPSFFSTEQKPGLGFSQWPPRTKFKRAVALPNTLAIRLRLSCKDLFSAIPRLLSCLNFFLSARIKDPLQPLLWVMRARPVAPFSFLSENFQGFRYTPRAQVYRHPLRDPSAIP